MLKVYPEWAATVDDFVVVNTEQRNQIRLNNTVPGLFFSFRYDLLVKRNDEYWLMDFKTTKQLPNNADWLLINNQAIAYQWAAEEVFGVPIAGIMYTYVRKKKPTVPKLLKSGRISKDKRIITTAQTYKNALDEHRLAYSDYTDHLNYIDSMLSEWFFRRFELRASKKQKQLHKKRVIKLAELMIDPDTYIYPSPNRMKCAACDFKTPCELLQMGQNIDNIIALEYEPKEPRE